MAKALKQQPIHWLGFELTTCRELRFAACGIQPGRIPLVRIRNVREHGFEGVGPNSVQSVVELDQVLMTMGNSLEPAFWRLLARQAGTEADPAAVAAAARRLLEDFAQRLTPLIGDGGVAAIYGRSLQLAERRFPGLAPPPASGGDGEPCTYVQHFLERQDPVVATKSAVTVLVVACEVLASFIGETLTRLLLHETWPDEFEGNPTETTT